VRRLVAAAVAAVLGVLAFGASPAQAAARPLTPAFFGMHDPGLDATVSYGALRLWDVGTTWAEIEAVPGVFDFTRLDALVAAAERRHLKVTLVLGSTPTWAATDPLSVSASWLPKGTSSPPTSEAYWARYVKTVARRYAGRIDSYQIWNEASLRVFWQGTPAALAQLTAVARREIRRADPAALVVSTPMLPRQPDWSTWSAAYLKALKPLGWPVDVFAVHSYQPDKQATPAGRVAGIRKMQSALLAAKAPVKPMWDTEANYSSNAFIHHEVTGQKAADWVARTYLDSLRLGVSRTYWYAFDARVGHLGVTLRPASTGARGYSSVFSWLVGKTWTGCTGSRTKVARTLVTTCGFLVGKKASYVVWATAPAKLPASAIKVRTVCTLLSGCRPITKGTRLGTSPVLLKR